MNQRSVIIGMVFMMATVLTGCVELGYYDQPVEVSSELKAAMDDAAKRLTGKWKQVKQGNDPVHLYDLTIKDDQSVEVERFGSFAKKEDASYKLGYDWKYKYKVGGQLVGHILFPASICLSVPYVCIIESGGNSMALCPDDGANYIVDPTMYFAKVEDESDNNE